MSKKRGLSLEEKRQCILQVFHESRDVFTLKDMEKLGMKKGVIQQSIKDVLQSLADDDLVHQEKIGSSNFFWSFPSEAAVKIEGNIGKLDRQLQEHRKQLAELEQTLAATRTDRQSTAEKSKKLAELQDLQQTAQSLQADLQQYSENDPERVEAIGNAALISRDCANRWLGNIEALRGWCKTRFEGMENQLESFFEENGINATMDYLA
ncbi:hypothetical protein WJX84_005307 [Apatococcus fuscideae]|uniref:Meiotic nuclear division protein 1 homolog n=1 Tax=Apatococcus fuscideae TaxID=2026836 RepID=A0AAW1TAW4_9CHLO